LEESKKVFEGGERERSNMNYSRKKGDNQREKKPILFYLYLREKQKELVRRGVWKLWPT